MVGKIKQFLVFLEAMLTGYEDKIEDNYFDNVWTKMANIVYLGKIYE